MREIKFRAWDGSRMFFDKDFNLHTIYKNQINDGKEPDILMQFTGLLDKNGKEIYGGDIVEYDYGNPLRRDIPNPKVRKVVFADGVFCLHEDESHYQMPLNTLLSAKLSACEVIGNIYENPNLLQ